MEEFLTIATTWPTAVYSVLLLASLGYWLVGLMGLAGDHGDGDMGDAGDADAGDADAGDADADAGGHGHGHGQGHGHGHAHVEGHGDATNGGALHTVMSALGALRLRHAPLSITFSVLFLFAWMLTFFGARYAVPLIPGPDALGGALVALGALIASVPITSLLTKPLGPFFKQNFAPNRHHLVGRVGVVRIAGGKDGSAQIRLKDPSKGEKGLLIRVATEENLKSGDEVLLVEYDDEKKAYLAEPMASVLPRKEDGS